MKKQELIARLNDESKDERIRALTELKKGYELRGEVNSAWVNNHIHTTYSFSPYSPTKAAYMAYVSGLETAGIMDHDSISGAEEFIEAGKVLGIPTTIGLETRVSMKGTPFSERLINNPDQKGNSYMAMHGIAHGQIAKVADFFAPSRAKRNIRNRAMSEKIAALVAPYGIEFDFDKDVLPATMSDCGGTVTERTLCSCLAEKIVGKFGRGAEVVDFLEFSLGLPVSAAQRMLLADESNPHYVFDLLGTLKSGAVSRFYIPADEECLTLKEFISFAKSVGAIPAYAYLGDVAQSPTGDKKAQKFEDDYLEELFAFLKEQGVEAIAYMPTRNSGEQLARLRKACKDFGFFEISGEDINSPRQSFVCRQLEKPEFSQLITATWALIGHEKSVTKDLESGMFSPKTIAATPNLYDRITLYASIGREK